MICIHVDDIIWSGNARFKSKVIMKLHSEFIVGNVESQSFRYLGLNITNEKDKISLSQMNYVDSIKPIALSGYDRSNKNADISEKDKDLLRSRIGQLLWVNNQSRPDISFDTCELASNFKNASLKDLVKINKTIRKVNEYPSELHFRKLSKAQKFVAFTDAAFGNLPDGGSQGSLLVFIVDEQGISNLLCWQSSKIKRVVRSTLAAETLALSNCIDSSIYIAKLYQEILYGNSNQTLPIEIYTDNKSLVASLYSAKSVSERRLRIDIGAAKEAINTKNIKSVKWIETKLQLADTMTKCGASNLALINAVQQGHLPI